MKGLSKLVQENNVTECVIGEVMLSIPGALFLVDNLVIFVVESLSKFSNTLFNIFFRVAMIISYIKVK